MLRPAPSQEAPRRSRDGPRRLGKRPSLGRDRATMARHRARASTRPLGACSRVLGGPDGLQSTPHEAQRAPGTAEWSEKLGAPWARDAFSSPGGRSDRRRKDPKGAAPRTGWPAVSQALAAQHAARKSRVQEDASYTSAPTLAEAILSPRTHTHAIGMENAHTDPKPGILLARIGARVWMAPAPL